MALINFIKSNGYRAWFGVGVIIFCLFPLSVFAQADPSIEKDEVFEARVIEVLEEEERETSSGQATLQQNLLLKGEEGEWKDKEFRFQGIGDFTVIKNKEYAPGDRVWAAVNYNDQGEPAFYVIDSVRTGAMWWLAGIFIIAVLMVGGMKGMRALFSLIITFSIIIGYIVPAILAGTHPLVPTLVGSTGILLIIIYFTEGFRLRSHIAVVSTFISLLFTIIFSWLFVGVASLSGITESSSSLLINIGDKVVNFEGLLLAGIIIGTLGVLDDVIVSQVSTVEQIYHANRFLEAKEAFGKAYKVGVSHISSMTNTLFLAYAGASLPLILLFVSGGSPFTSWVQIINNEAIATEIVRTLTGSVGIVLSVPLSTAIAAWGFKRLGVKEQK